jgi:hypothetical protein
MEPDAAGGQFSGSKRWWAVQINGPRYERGVDLSLAKRRRELGEGKVTRDGSRRGVLTMFTGLEAWRLGIFAIE